MPRSPAAVTAAADTAALREQKTVAEHAVAGAVAAGAPAPAATLVRRWTLATTFLGVLLALAVVAVLSAARTLLVPLVAAGMLAMALAPVVRALRRRGVPQAVAAIVAALGMVATLAAMGKLLLEPITRALDTLPAFEGLLARLQWGAVRMLGEPSAAWLGVRWQEVVTSGTWPGRLFAGLFEFGALALATLLLTFFLLASGDLFLQKLVRVLPRIRDKVKAVKVVALVQDDVGHYLGIATLINLALGTITALIAWTFELPNPLLWGTLVALLNFIPYVGAMVNVVILTAVSAATHATLGDILAAPLVFAVVTAIEGHVLTPLIIGKRIQLNAVTVVVGLMFWSWVWGLAGALLAVPMLIVMKAFAQHVDQLQPLNEFMSP